MRTPSTAFVVFTALVTVGCNQPISPTSPTRAPSITLAVATSTADVNSTSATHLMSVRGRLDGSFTISGEPPAVTVHLEAGGVASHFGRFRFDSTHIVNFVDFKGAGTAVLTAANGDELYTDLAGGAIPQETPGVLLITETLTVTGGTGRFAGASGELIVERLAYALSPTNGTTSGSLEGTLSLPNGNN